MSDGESDLLRDIATGLIDLCRQVSLLMDAVEGDRPSELALVKGDASRRSRRQRTDLTLV